MKDLVKDLKEVYVKHRSMFTLMAVMTIFSIILFIYSIVNLHPNASVVKGRYQGGEWSSMSNSGGYHDGAWHAMLVYPLFALIFGVLHNVIALRLYRKKGDKVASVFLVVTIAVILFAILILWRLLGEG